MSYFYKMVLNYQDQLKELEDKLFFHCDSHVSNIDYETRENEYHGQMIVKIIMQRKALKEKFKKINI